jgi:hypothetical protein
MNSVARAPRLGLCVASLSAAAPVLGPGVLPFMDWPQHLALVRGLIDPASPLVADVARTPHALGYLLVAGLARLTDVDLAARIVLGGCLAATPWALLAWLRASGRDPALAILGAPLAWNSALFLGLVQHVAAVPALLVALAVLATAMRSDRKNRWILPTLLVLALAACHVIAVGLYLLLGSVVAWHERRPGTPVWSPLPQSPLVHVLPGLMLGATGVAVTAKDSASTLHVAYWEHLGKRLLALHDRWLDVYCDAGDEAVLVGIIVLACAGWRLRTANARSPLPLRVLLALLVFYLLAPQSWGFIWPFSHRFVPILGLLAVACAPDLPQGLARRAWIAAAVLGCIATAGYHRVRLAAFAAEAAPGLALIARLPAHTHLAGMPFAPASAIVAGTPYLHFHAWHAVQHPGLAQFSFAAYPTAPVHMPAGVATVPPGSEWNPGSLDPERLGGAFDAVLVRDGGTAEVPFQGRAPWRLDERRGPFALWWRGSGRPDGP